MGAAPELHDVFPAKFNSFVLNQVDNQSFSPGVEALIAQAGGSVDPALEAVATADPRWKFMSRDIQTILQNVALMVGLQVTSGARMQLQRRANAGAGIYRSGASHFVLTAPIGYLFIEEFGFERNSKEGGDISLQFAALFNGTDTPVSINVSQNLQGVPAVNSVHALGPVVIEGAQLTGVTKWRFKTGIEIEINTGDGETTSRVCTVQKRAPSLEIEALNQTFLDSAGIGGFTKPMTDGITCFAQRVLHGGDRYSWSDSEHISATISEGMYTVQEISSQKAGQANTKITATAINNEVSVNPATTIVLP